MIGTAASPSQAVITLGRHTWTSVELDARRLQQRRPTEELFLDELRGLLRSRIDHRLKACRDQLLLKRLVCRRPTRHRRKLFDDRPRRGARCEHPHELQCYEIRKSYLGADRDVWRGFELARTACDQNANLALRMHLKHLRRNAGCKHRQLSAVEVCKPGIGSPIGHMDNIRQPGK